MPRARRWVTDAPEDYDYRGTATLMVLTDTTGRSARIIEADDDERFCAFQLPRYYSGNHYCAEIGTTSGDFYMSRLTQGE